MRNINRNLLEGGKWLLYLGGLLLALALVSMLIVKPSVSKADLCREAGGAMMPNGACVQVVELPKQ